MGVTATSNPDVVRVTGGHSNNVVYRVESTGKTYSSYDLANSASASPSSDDGSASSGLPEYPMFEFPEIIFPEYPSAPDPAPPAPPRGEAARAVSESIAQKRREGKISTVNRVAGRRSTILTSGMGAEGDVARKSAGGLV